MAEDTVILGTEEANASGSSTIRVTTSHGDVFVVETRDIVRKELAEAGGLLTRFVIAQDATVFLELQGTKLVGADAMTGTILKWYDDGGTIRKSLDDN